MRTFRHVLILVVVFSGLLACDNKDDSSKKKPPGKITEMAVGDQKVACASFLGSVPNTSDCLSVQEAGYEFPMSLSEIEGFSYEPGYVYRIRVELIPVENALQDAPSLRYRLVEVLSKTPVP